MADTIETTWDQLQAVIERRLQSLPASSRSRRVTVQIQPLPEQDIVVVKEETTSPAHDPAERQEWVRQLRTWAESHAPLPHEVDDSRDTIYADAVRDLD